MDRNDPVGGPSMFRNAWHAASINPDGTGLSMWGGTFREDEQNHVYGGTFTPEGDFVANFFPMYNMTEAAGFGGLRKYARGRARLSGADRHHDAHSRLRQRRRIQPRTESSRAPTRASRSRCPTASSSFPGPRIINRTTACTRSTPTAAGGRCSTTIREPPSSARGRSASRGLPPVIADTVTQVPSSAAARRERAIRQGRHVHVRRAEHLRQCGVDEQSSARPRSARPRASASSSTISARAPAHSRAKTGRSCSARSPCIPTARSIRSRRPPTCRCSSSSVRASNTVPLTGGHVRDGAGHVEV